jgi:hypothetical protein
MQLPNRFWIGVLTSLAWLAFGLYTVVAGADETWQRVGWLIIVVGLLRAVKVVRDWKRADPPGASPRD